MERKNNFERSNVFKMIIFDQRKRTTKGKRDSDKIVMVWFKQKIIIKSRKKQNRKVFKKIS
jgi:hypothetical protein